MKHVPIHTPLYNIIYYIQLNEYLKIEIGLLNQYFLRSIILKKFMIFILLNTLLS